jgi:hypothetical protein
MDSFALGLELVAGSCEYSNEPSGFIKGRWNFLIN